ncbi:MAG: hydrolase [Myxococcota bacterium]
MTRTPRLALVLALAVTACGADATPGADTGVDTVAEVADTTADVGDATAEIDAVDATQAADSGDGEVAITGCGGAPLCDDFESVGAPDAARWSIVSPNCSGTGQLALDGDVAHSGHHAVRVTGGGGYCNHVFLRTPLDGLVAVRAPVHARFWLRLGDALGDGHTTFIAMHDAVADKDVRIGGQSRILMWNRESDDATLPVLSPTGIAHSKVLPVDTWVCVELVVDGQAGTLATWVDGEAVDGLAVDGSATPELDEQWLRQAWHPELRSFGLGWESYAGQALTLWFDDVAIGPDPIGCGEPAP